MASLFIGHAAQKSKLHNLQYDEGGNHMAETETEDRSHKTIHNQREIILYDLSKKYKIKHFSTSYLL